jgi:hypothetical protein
MGKTWLCDCGHMHKDKWQALVYTAIKFGLHKLHFLIRKITIDLSGRVLLHGGT